MAVGDAVESRLSSDVIEFRTRDYTAEAKAHSLPRVPADAHPLSSSPCFSLQVDVVYGQNGDTLDPLRASHGDIAVPSLDLENSENAFKSEISGANSIKLLVKEWTTFKRFLVQKFPTAKTLSVSSIADSVIGGRKASAKLLSTHLDELEDPQGSADEDAKFVTQQEYIARLIDMKSEIAHAWHADDHVKSLKLTVKVARLLRDTALLQFYPTLFGLVTDILGMLGDMVWERIKHKAEFSEDGLQIHSLREDFGPSDVCSDAKETCHNWFCKIGSIRELLPRIYLELAILPCWRFLRDDTDDILPRLVAMMRGLGDPLASAYCHLYLAYCAQKLAPREKGYLITSIRNMSLVMTPIISSKEAADDKSYVRNQVLVRLMEPPVEYIMKCIFKDQHQQASDVLLELGLGRNPAGLLGKYSCVSVILHHLLKELPPEIVDSNAVMILDLIEGSADVSFDQCMNFRLLGFRLYERDPSLEVLNIVLDRILQIVCQYQDLDAYLKVVGGYVDIILQKQMKSQLETLLKGIADRACNKWVNDSEMESLQSVFAKILAHKNCLKEILELNHFIEIMDVMHGSSRDVVYMRILELAMRNGHISCPTTMEFLYQVCQGLHDGVDSSTLDADNQHLSRLLTRFVEMVDFGTEWESHLAFLIRCRGAFACADRLKETLVHRGNCLAIKALKDSTKQFALARSCLAFCEATIPSVSTPVKQLILYLETAEVALISGLLSHADGLLDSAMICLQSIGLFNDSRISMDVDRIISMVQKLCSILIMIPGDPRRGIVYFPKTLLSLVKSQSSWMTTRLKVRTLCAIISSLAASAQNKLLYNVRGTVEVPGNNLVFFDDPLYHEELASFCHYVLQNVLHTIREEDSPVARGNLALDTCHCIATFLKMNDNTLAICKELMEIAQSSLSRQHKYLGSTVEFLAMFSK
uniref:Uncharacterized protein n=1 Tax=Opuntia streptacantha TaxID=393608 RepID=A0A7C9AE96_OPUST